MTAIHVAMKCHSFNTFMELLHFKANMNVKNNYGNTPLHMCVIENHFVKTRILIHKGADINIQNNYRQLPLHIAYEKDECDLINFFLYRSSINSCDFQDKWEHFLALSCTNNNYKQIDYLIDKGASLNLMNCYTNTPLHIAIQNDCYQAFDRLIYLGYNVNAKNGEGQTSLHVAVCRRVLSLVGRLVNSGADLELKDKYG